MLTRGPLEWGVFFIALMLPGSSAATTQLEIALTLVYQEEARDEEAIHRIRDLRELGQFDDAEHTIEEFRRDPTMNYSTMVRLALERALVQSDQQDYERALDTAYDALELARKPSPSDPILVADVSIVIAQIFLASGQADSAMHKSREAWALKRETIGEEHPSTLQAGCAMIHMSVHAGRHREVLAVARKLVDLGRSTFSRSDPRLFQCIAELGEIHRIMGKYDEAERNFLEVARWNEDYDPNSIDAGVSLMQLGHLYLERGEHDRVQDELERAKQFLNRYDEAGGTRATRAKIGLIGLAILLANARGEPETAMELLDSVLNRASAKSQIPDQMLDLIAAIALDLCQRSSCIDETDLLATILSYRETQHGELHISTANARWRMGLARARRADFERAFYDLDVVSIFLERLLGRDHPTLIGLHRDTASVRWLSNAVEDARHRLILVAEHEHALIDQMVLMGEETRRLEQVRDFDKTVDGIFTILKENSGEFGAENEYLLQLAFNRKLRVMEVMAKGTARLQRCFDDENAKIGDLRDIQRRYATLLSSSSTASTNQSARALSEQARDLWRYVHRKCPRDERGYDFEIKELQRKIPAQAALLEYMSYRPWVRERNQVMRGPRRYGVSVVSADQVSWLDLGNAEEIDRQISELRKSIFNHKSPDSSSLRQRLIDGPIGVLKAADIRRIIIAPDKGLSLIPFAALKGSDNRYLVEDYRLQHVMSGRDLLRSSIAVSTGPGLIVLGTDTLGWVREEAEYILSEFGAHNFEDIRGANATEYAILSRKRPWLVHFGAHGRSSLERSSQVGESPKTRIAVDFMPEAGNAMLESWLEVAAGTQGQGLDGDGLLTAFEISGWDLRGTQMVTLAACNSGVGDVSSYSEMVGLQRAFFLAGSQTQVVSLWAVDDERTADLMKRYYSGLAVGLGTGTAMRSAQLGLIAEGYRDRPDQWASFVVFGDDRGLIRPPCRSPGGGCITRSGAGESCRPMLLFVIIGLRRRNKTSS